MSVTTNMFCPRTLTSLWVGQGEIIYTGDEDVMGLLTAFLHANSGLPLYFLTDYMMSTIIVDLLPTISPSKEYGSSSSDIKVIEFKGEGSMQVVSKEVYDYLEDYLNSRKAKY